MPRDPARRTAHHHSGRPADGLEDTLHRADGRGYPAYRDLKGTWDLGHDLTLHVDRVQADPFAPASLMRVSLPRASAALPADLIEDLPSRVATADFVQRRIAEALARTPGGVSVGTPTQEIIERTGVAITESHIEARLTVPLPADRRRVQGHRAARTLARDLPDAVGRHLHATGLDLDALREHVGLYRDQLGAQAQLAERGLIAFVRDGAVLPRSSGVSELPLQDAVAFRSPESLTTTLDLPSGGTVTGMGIPEGVTVIVGGGFHGKSTLLSALARGVHPHVAGDGREFVLSRPDAVTVRAEDGRAVTGVDISPFIDGLPSGKDTRRFTTPNASGSTSQAAGIVEALEVGASTLLLDEDTCATNFMLRDDTMRSLIPEEFEPITPFVERVAGLRAAGVSTVIVAGGSGAFLPHADLVLALHSYVPEDLTDRAHELTGTRDDAGDDLWRRGPGGLVPTSSTGARVPAQGALTPPAARGKHPRPPAARGRGRIRMGEDTIDATAASQLVDDEQTEGVARAMARLAEAADGHTSLADAVGHLTASAGERGLSALLDDRDHPGHVALPRPAEIAAAVNRYRGLRLSR